MPTIVPGTVQGATAPGNGTSFEMVLDTPVVSGRSLVVIANNEFNSAITTLTLDGVAMEIAWQGGTSNSKRIGYLRNLSGGQSTIIVTGPTSRYSLIAMQVQDLGLPEFVSDLYEPTPEGTAALHSAAFPAGTANRLVVAQLYNLSATTRSGSGGSAAAHAGTAPQRAAAVYQEGVGADAGSIAWGLSPAGTDNAAVVTFLHEVSGPPPGDEVAPTYSSAPALVPGSETIGGAQVSSTAADETSAVVGKAFVVLADGAPAPASGADVFALTGNAASPLDSGSLTGASAVANGVSSTFVIEGLESGTAYDYYEALVDAAGNYRLSARVDFSTIAQGTGDPVDDPVYLGFGGSPGGTANSASVSPAPNSLVLAAISFGLDSGVTDLSTITSTFATLGWNILERPDPVGTRNVRTAWAWAIATASPGTGVVTSVLTNGASRHWVRVHQIQANYHPVTPIRQVTPATSPDAGSSIAGNFPLEPRAGSVMLSVAAGSVSAALEPAAGWTELSQNDFDITTNTQRAQAANGTAFGATFAASQTGGMSILAIEIQPPADPSTPSLTGGSATADATTGPTGNTASLGIGTNVSNGTLYWNIRSTSAVPSVAEIQAGTGAVASGSQAVSTLGQQSIPGVGSLAENTGYFVFFQQRTAAGNDSTVTGPFALNIPLDAPVLSAAVASATGASTASLSVNTNRAVGTLYVVVTTSVTQPTPAQIVAGQNHLGAAAAFAANDTTPTSPQAFAATGLVAGQGYFAHFYQVDAQDHGSNRLTSNSFTTGTARAIVSFTPTVPRPGQEVVVVLSGGWSASGKTANLNGHAVTLVSQTAAEARFIMPELHTDPTFSDSRYGADLPFVLSDSGQDVTRLLNAQPPLNYDYLAVASVSDTGIWSNDTDVSVGDFHLGFYASGSGNPITTAGDLTEIQAPAVYRYWLFDISAGQWSASADEELFERVTSSGALITAPLLYEGVAIAAIDPTIGFNAAAANIVSYATVAGTLPPGLSINAQTGQITGTPSVGSNGTRAGIVVRATDGDGNTADSAAFAITVHSAPSWVSTPVVALGDGQVVDYDLTQHLDPTFATATAFSLAGGTLPAGMGLNPSTGRLTGTLGQVSGSSPFTGIQIQASNPAGSATSPAFSITVAPAAPAYVGPLSLPALIQGQAMTPLDVSAAFGGGAAASYQLLGSWPTGLSINASGVISGVPTQAGSFTGLQIRAINATGQVSSPSLSMTVSTNLVAPSWSPISNISVAESASGTRLQLANAIAGGTGPLIYGISAGSLPLGWSLNQQTGVVTSPGNRDNEGVYNVTFSATGPGGAASSNSVQITVTSSNPTVAVVIEDQTHQVGTAISLDVRANFAGESSWSATGIPPGVVFSGGVFSGNVTQVGSFNVTVTAINAFGQVQDSFVWSVTPQAQIPVVATLVPPQWLIQGDVVEIELDDFVVFATSYSADVLPAGLTLTNGVISGTVTTVQNVLTTITATNADGSADFTIDFSVASGAPELAVSAVPNLVNVRDRLMSRDMRNFFRRPGTVTLSAGTLPAGLSISNGVVSGTPTTNGESVGFTLTATNSFGSVVSATFTWTIRDAVPSRGIVLGMGLGV